MSQPYIGEIRMFAGNFAPQGWLLCQGQLLAIAQYDVLFNLIGTTYGGDGQNTFALPDLRSRVPVHQGAGFIIGQSGGEESVTLTTQQIPQHTHPAVCNANSSSSPTPAGSYWGAASSNAYTAGTSANAVMNPAAVGAVGGSQPHDNMMPYVTLNYIISTNGIYPSQT
jgi:microcystin-dependent protein